MAQKKMQWTASNNLIDLDVLGFLRFVLRKFKVVLAFVLIGVLIAGIYAFVIAAPVYESTAQLYVVNSKDSVLNLSDLQIGSYLTTDYQLVFKTWEVNQQVIQNLDLPYSVSQLKSMLTVTNPSNTRALFITVASSDPKEAAVIANEYANVASIHIAETMLTETPTILSAAQESTSPVSPNKKLILLIGVLLSGFVAVWILFVQFMRNDWICTSEDVMKYTGDLPLAVVPMLQTEKRRQKGGGRR